MKTEKNNVREILKLGEREMMTHTSIRRAPHPCHGPSGIEGREEGPAHSEGIRTLEGEP